MKTLKKKPLKLLSLFLSVLLVFGAFPIVAFALETPTIIENPNYKKTVLMYGEPFSALGLEGGKASVPGTFSFRIPNLFPNTIGDSMFRTPIVFTPDDTTTYETITFVPPTAFSVVQSTVARVEGTLSATMQKGQKLSEAELVKSSDFKMMNFHTEHSYTISWENPDKIMDKAGECQEKVFIASFDVSEDLIKPIEMTITVNVIGEEEVVELKEAPAASEIKLGQTLADSALTGGLVTKGENPVAGKFAWKDSTIAPKVGTAKYTAVFTPDDPTACDPIETQVSVTTGKGAPEITAWPEVKGQYRKGMGVHSCVTLTGGEANIPGKFGISVDYIYKAIPESITETMDIELYFEPDDKANYEDVYEMVTVTFEPAIPDCEVTLDILSETEVRVNSFIKNKENWDLKTGKLFFIIDGEKIELDEPSKSFVYDSATIAAGTHTVQTVYEKGENDVYVSDESDVQEFNTKAIYAVNVTDFAGTNTLGSYLPGKTVTVTATPHEKSYYDFTGWTAEGITLTEEEAAQQTLTFEMPENEVNLTANYKFNFCNFVKAVFEKIGQVLLGIITEGIAWLKDAIQNIPRP